MHTGYISAIHNPDPEGMITTLTRIRFLCFLALPALVLAACGTSVHYVKPPDWTDVLTRDSTITSLGPAFRGVVIFVDPGHGGEDAGFIGPTGTLREADVNLRVALRLREYLKRAGASVIMSRETDVAVPVEARAQQANVNNASMFVSIHHNAAPDMLSNHTATMYHSRSGSAGYQPSSHDLARYIQRDLAHVIGNPGPLTSFDGTLSDMQLEPEQGLLTLRPARMTAVLVECAFISSAYEERRLKIAEFNDIEAWGIFRGIARYLNAGIPTLKYSSPIVFPDPLPRLDINATDKTGILDESIRVFVDGKEEGFTYDRKTGRISVTVSRELSRGYHLLTAQVRNLNENACAPFSQYFAIGSPPALLRQTTEPTVLPPDPQAYSIVTITAVDTSGASMPDGLPIHVSTSDGLDTTIALTKGEATLTIGPGRAERVTFEASSGPVKTQGSIAIIPGTPYLRGIVMSPDGRPVTTATIAIIGSGAIVPMRHGEYIIAGSSTAGLEAFVTAPGYFARREVFTESPVQDPIVLAPVARGVLQGRRVLLDLRAPEVAASKTARVDERTLTCIEHLLRVSGANVEILPPAATRKKERQALLAASPDAVVIQVGVRKKLMKTALLHGAGAQTRSMAEQMSRALGTMSEFGSQAPMARPAVRDEFDKARIISIGIPGSDKKAFDAIAVPRIAWGIAWGVYSGMLAQEGYKLKGTKNVEVKVVDKATRKPAPNAEVELNHALRMVTDINGVCVFRAVSIQEDDVRLLEPDKYEITGVKTESIN